MHWLGNCTRHELMDASTPTEDSPSTNEPGDTKPAPRTGGALFRATKAYAEEDISRTWREFAATALVLTGAELTTWFAPYMVLQLVAGVVMGLTLVRLFIFYHDYLHGAIFRKSKAGDWAMFFTGLYMLNPPVIWKETHDYHHRNNAKITGAAIGSYPVATTRMWAMMKPEQRRNYALTRHPAIITMGYFTLFTVGMCIAPFVREPRKYWDSGLALVVHFGTLVAVGLAFGLDAAFFGILLPFFIAFAAGAYLFYAQHNFPGIVLRDRTKWDYTHAALKSSSMFDMSPVMHWFTGNIGYHHVHHLNHRIPFYRLPEAMAGVPELQHPTRTSWHPRDIMACLRLKLWDKSKGEMVPFPDY